MANILVLGVKVPFTRGGAEVLSASLVKELRARGHDADTVEIPYSTWPKEVLLNQAAIWRSLDLSQYGEKKVDLVIGTKFPSYFARHPKKSIWMVHQHRALYDLYGTRFSDISDDPRDESLRQLLVKADESVISEAQYISGISANVVNRLKHYNSISAQVLYPPLPLGQRYCTKPAENYILSVGRLCNIKRADLMIKALPMVHQFVKLKIVGVADEPGVMDYYKNEIDKHHLWERVEFLGRVSDEELIDLYARAMAVYYAPFNEDYGYVTLEAFASSKGVITAHDSGGTLEFVKHQENGLIAEPTSESIASCVNSLAQDKELALKLGANGRRFIESSELLERGWDLVIERLLSPLKESGRMVGNLS